MIDTMEIDDKYIEEILNEAKNQQSKEEIDAILDKAASFKGLNHKEVAQLMTCTDDVQLERMFSIAQNIKEAIYGKRIVMFAPIYVSDYCVNQCVYCSYSCTNNFERRKLTMDEIKQEIKVLESMGHKRLALEAGEDDENCPIEYILEAIETIYSMKTDDGEIRRINVNIAATSVENYTKLKDAGIGTYILFQETYHRETYAKVHPQGPKSNFDYHLNAFNRAMEAGLDDVGGGVLFGLHKPEFELLSLMIHNEHLEEKFGVGFHTVSVPRICKSTGGLNLSFPNAVDDETFLKLVSIIRIAVPYTGIIVSTRETKDMRQKLIHLGVSQISSGSITSVGGYAKEDKTQEQFGISDDRTSKETINWLIDEGMIPCFCTACYRSGRTGDRFMELAKSGNIKNVCHSNALMTLYEYALDYGDEALQEKAWTVIERELDGIEHERVKELIVKNIEKIKEGARDLYV